MNKLRDGYLIIRKNQISYMNPQARKMLGISTLAGLHKLSETSEPPFAEQLRALIDEGTPLDWGIRHADGRTNHLVGAPTRGGVGIQIHDITNLTRPFLSRLARVDVVEAKANRLNALFKGSAHPVWMLDDQGQISWANDAYKALLEDMNPDGQGQLFEQPLAFSAENGRQKVGQRVFEVSHRQDGTGGTAVEVTADAQAEENLRFFLTTLTQTFARLPDGLMVFDAEKRLILFNTTVADMLGLAPSFLAMRPSLRAILDRLRHEGKIPEPKDFRQWRKRLLDLEETARAGQFSENWTLLDGKVVRVTGHPHPGGALSFQFENISSMTRLERRLREESAKLRSLSDQVGEGLAIFDASGRLVSQNAVYAEIAQSLGVPIPPNDDPQAMVAFWQKVFADPIDAEYIQNYLLGGADREPYNRVLKFIDGRKIDATLSPLPDGGSLLHCRLVSSRGKHLREQLNKLRDEIAVLQKVDDVMPDHITQLLRIVEEASRIAKVARNETEAPQIDNKSARNG
ncbi:PAS-domain containing protein [Paracoccaceae bacterium GXU_MW_L88]